MAENKYLEITHYNNSKQEEDIALRYKGESLLTDEMTSLIVWRWNIKTLNFPIWIPRIVDDNNYKPYYPEFSGANESNTSALYLETNAYFLTDWAITIENITFPDGIPSSHFYTYPVQWMKDKFINDRQIAPNVQYDANGYVDEAFILENKYFWCQNSEFICDIITSTFDKCGIPSGVFKFVKNGEYWSILHNAGTTQKNKYIIYFNEPMRKYFNFYYSWANGTGIALEELQTTVLDNNEYFINTTASSNSKLFPFEKVVFTSPNMPVFPYFVASNNEITDNRTDNVISSYTLNISDISSLGDSIEFSTEAFDRALKLSDGAMIPFTISVYLITRRGYPFKLKLLEDDTASILLMFF